MDELEYTLDLLIDVFSDKPKGNFKWVDFGFWYWSQGHFLNEEMSKDEIINRWKSISVYADKELDKEFIEHLKTTMYEIDNEDEGCENLGVDKS